MPATSRLAQQAEKSGPDWLNCTPLEPPWMAKPISAMSWTPRPFSATMPSGGMSLAAPGPSAETHTIGRSGSPPLREGNFTASAYVPPRASTSVPGRGGVGGRLQGAERPPRRAVAPGGRARRHHQPPLRSTQAGPPHGREAVAAAPLSFRRQGGEGEEERARPYEQAAARQAERRGVGHDGPRLGCRSAA